jgi:hypothetical protein
MGILAESVRPRLRLEPEIVGTNAVSLALKDIALNLPNLRMPCQTTPHQCFFLRPILISHGLAPTSGPTSEST